jgi:hypothetical protein
MKQIRITSKHFVHQGETGDADAVLHPDDLNEIKRLAGIVTEAEGGMYTGVLPVPNSVPGDTPSPVGSNISVTAQERRLLEKEYHVKVGSELWFIINFTKPFLNGSLRQHVEDYLKDHPEDRPRHWPNP